MNIFLVIVNVILVLMAAGILTCLSDIEKKLEKLDEVIDQLRPIHSVASRRDRDETNAQFMDIERNFRGSRLP